MANQHLHYLPQLTSLGAFITARSGRTGRIPALVETFTFGDVKFAHGVDALALREILVRCVDTTERRRVDATSYASSKQRSTDDHESGKQRSARCVTTG